MRGSPSRRRPGDRVDGRDFRCSGRSVASRGRAGGLPHLATERAASRRKGLHRSRSDALPGSGDYDAAGQLPLFVRPRVAYAAGEATRNAVCASAGPAAARSRCDRKHGHARGWYPDLHMEGSPRRSWLTDGRDVSRNVHRTRPRHREGTRTWRRGRPFLLDSQAVVDELEPRRRDSRNAHRASRLKVRGHASARSSAMRHR